ncbi:MAG TPA: polysaccharide biosynthesis tyrosine autokinase [Azospirillum sp.]
MVLPDATRGAGPLRAKLGREADLRHMLRTLWRRRVLLAVCLLLGASAAWAYVSGITPVYTATTQVMLDTRRPRVIDLKDVLSQLQPQLVTVNSEVEVLRSRTVAERVATALNLYDDPEFNPSLRAKPEESDLVRSVTALWNEVKTAIVGEKPEPQVDEETRRQALRAGVVGGLLGRMSVAAVPQSLVIRISFNSTDPHKAARIANAFADAYVVEQLETKFEAVRRATTWLNSRLESLREAVVDSERQVVAYRTTTGLIESRGQLGAQQKLGELNSQLVVAQSKRAETEARISRIETLLKTSRGSDALDEVLDSPLVQHLKEQEAQLAREASDLLSRYAERHPQMLKVRAELAQVRSRIASEVDRLVQGLRGELVVLRSRESGLAGQIREVESRVLEQNRAEVRLRELEREAQANRAIYEAFLSRFKETGEQEHIQQADVRIISQAEVPGAPSYPRTRLLISAAAMLGLVAGTVLVLVLEQLDNTFRNRDQLEEATGLPALGLIPAIQSATGRRRVESYLSDNPASSFAEAFRITWFALKHSLPDDESKVVVVTSSVPEEGKSLTALSLARTAANLSLRVVLVDADLRRSSIAEMLNLQLDRGIADVLSGQATVDDVVVKDPRSNVDVLSGRPIKPRQLDLVASNSFAGLVADLRERYDLVVIDSPPTLPVADVQMLVQLADRTVFCVRWDKTPRESVVSALRMLMDVNANIAGTLLTRVNVRKHARYGYGDLGHYYGRYRSYYAE